MKKRGILVACLALGTTVTISAFTHKVVSANMKTQAISYKGNILNQEILTYNNTTYVPLRSFSELVGVPIDYKNGTIYLNDTSNNNSVTNNVNQTSSSQNTNTNSSTYIGTEKAEQIALNHAKLTKQQAGYIRNKLDKDDGRWEYEIEFRYGTTEYEYNINAYTGEIVDYSIDND